MASIYELKPAFQGVLRPLTGLLARSGVTANQVTVAALLLSLLTGVLIAWKGNERWPLFLLPLVLFIRMALNAIDGMLAREHGMKTKLGGVLNELGDVISDTALYLPLGLLEGVSPLLVALVVVLAVTSEMTGVLGIPAGGGRRYEGPMGKSDRAFVFGVLGLALGFRMDPGWLVDALLGTMALLLGLTILNRARRAIGPER
jgi:CDP-diacylglycerol--glycerol-3-phosphate 3-phosphatidyltransferase